MSQRILRTMIVGSILLLLLNMTALPTFAASLRLTGDHPLSPIVFASASHVSHVILKPSIVIGDTAGPHYLYVEDGYPANTGG